ncbi:MAG: hypothetical protein MAG453_02111 [Calditrichaeota bacterium]|nr:hypothetical protein [Calditrichota bacterium]
MNGKSVAAAAAALLLAIGAVTAFAYEWVTLGPENDGDTVGFMIAGHERLYHRLEPGESMFYDISDHDRIRIITRADMRASDERELVYTFRLGYEEDDLRLYARAATADKGVALKDRNDVAGDSRILVKDTPSGADYLYATVDRDAPVPVFFRVQRDRFETIRQEDFVAYTPTRYENPVKVSVRENVITYFGVDPKGNLEVTVIGPTVMKVLARVMMEDHMRRKIKFPLAIYEDNVLKRTVLISTSASDVAVLPDHPDRRPTRGDDIYINVPEGQHKYTFDLPENEYDSILRFFIPESDLGREAG